MTLYFCHLILECRGFTSIVRLCLIKCLYLSLVSKCAADDDNSFRLVLLGRTGAGKSATGNTILGEELFTSSLSASSVTGECKKESRYRFGHRIEVVDTPGIFDTSQTNKEVQREISECITITSPGPHAFILVLTLSRFTEEEGNSIDHFIKYFGEHIYDYTIIIFTGKDNLDRHKTSLSSYLKTSTQGLKKLTEKCGGRVIAFNNNLENQGSEEQVKSLFELISQNMKKNGYKHYTSVMYMEAEKIIKIKEEKMKQKAIEEKERQMQEMKKQVEHEYDIKLAEKEKEKDILQGQIQMYKKKKADYDNQIEQLIKKIEHTENKHKESEGKEKERLQNELHELQIELTKKRITADNQEKENERVQNDNKKKDEEIDNLKKQREKDTKSMKQEITAKFEKIFATLRNEVVKVVNVERSVMSHFAKAFNLMGENIRNFVCGETKNPEKQEDCPDKNLNCSIDTCTCTPVTTENDKTPVTTKNDKMSPNGENISKSCNCNKAYIEVLREELMATGLSPLYDKIASSCDTNTENSKA